MFALFILLYLAVYSLCMILGSAIGIPLWSGASIAIALCLLLELAMVQIVKVYQPNLKPQVAALVRLSGVRWMLVLTLTAGFAIVIFCVASTRALPDAWAIWLITPVLGLTALNLIGVEISPNALAVEPNPGKIVMPDVSPVPVEEMETEIVKHFAWAYRESNYSILLILRKSCYKEAIAQPRNLNSDQWSMVYVTRGMCGEVHALALELARLQQSYGTYEEVSFVLAFVQHVIEYKTDVGEYPRYPIETMAESGGDCEDSAILGAAILLAMGYEVALLFLPGHCALGVAGASGMQGESVAHGGFQYFYCEMTAEGWTFGKMPDDFTVDQIKVSPVPYPPTKVVSLPQQEQAAG